MCNNALQIDTEKLARFDKLGHRVTGDRVQNTRALAGRRFVWFSQMLADETTNSACTTSPRFVRLLRLGIAHHAHWLIGKRVEKLQLAAMAAGLGPRATPTGSLVATLTIPLLMFRFGSPSQNPYTPQALANANLPAEFAQLTNAGVHSTKASPRHCRTRRMT